MLSSSSLVCLSARLGDKRLTVQYCKYSPNSRCRPSSCLLAVLAMFLANSSPISSSWNEWNVPSFCTHCQNNSISSPGLLQWLTVQFSGNYAAQLTSFSHIGKFFQIWSTVADYAWNFSQSETEKYFEWIIILDTHTKARFNTELFCYSNDVIAKCCLLQLGKKDNTDSQKNYILLYSLTSN